MTIKELVSDLQKYDPALEVTLFNDNWEIHQEIEPDRFLYQDKKHLILHTQEIDDE